MREAGTFDQRPAKVTYHGDLVDGIPVMGATANTMAMSNTRRWRAAACTATPKIRSHMAVVTFIGADLKDTRFPETTDPMGKTIQIDGRAL